MDAGLMLVATFDVDLPGQMMVAWPETEPISVTSHIDEFTVTITLVPLTGARSKGAGESNYTYTLAQAKVRVEKAQAKPPPKPTRTEQGGTDWTGAHGEYFRERIGEYGPVAQMATNRLIQLFKYELNTPSLTEFSEGHEAFRNAQWTDENDEVVGKSPSVMVVKGIPGLRGELHVKKLTLQHKGPLSAWLESPSTPLLHEEILADARTAFFASSYRRTVLELAIACEVRAKEAFFSSSSPARAAFDYLEKSGRAIRVIDLIDKVAKEAFGRSFRKEQLTDWQNIDHLFRCRNRVAHRGKLGYKNDSDESVEVSADTIEEWWKSVQALMRWLEELLEGEV